MTNQCDGTANGNSTMASQLYWPSDKFFKNYSKFHTVATKPGAGRPVKTTERERRLMKFEQLRDDTYSLNDLVRYSHTNLNLSVSRSTISRILRGFNMISYIAPRKPRVTSVQRRNRITWCYEHLNWSVRDWSNVVFSDEISTVPSAARLKYNMHTFSTLPVEVVYRIMDHQNDRTLFCSMKNICRRLNQILSTYQRYQ
ncbi:unnamed protein product, partial [Adineta ricciae]